MPCHPDRVRRNYEAGQPKPESRCPCGAAMNEPHAPDCYKRDMPPLEPTEDDLWGI